MKLYFMIGLPSETDGDVEGIMETGRRMKQIGRRYHGRAAGITVSVSSHVPKPHTPFQWVAMDPIEEIERKQDILWDLARRYRLEFRRHDPRTSLLEGILGRGDRRVATAIELAWRGGARFDGWNDLLNWDAWLSALDESGIDPQLYLGTIATDARLPWDHLDMQLEPRFLLRDYKRALKDKLSPPCGKPVGAQVHYTNVEEHDADQRLLVCYNCGVACDMEEMRSDRREFLVKLGAFAPVAESTAKAERIAKQQRVRRGEAPHKFDQGQPVRVRLQFTKLGADAMAGHLDLVRKLPRILRRAGLPVFYTEGYHPKPAITFGPALALGIESCGELAEVKLTSRVEPTEILRRMNEVAEDGLRFEGCRILERGEPGLASVIQRADYLIRLRGALELPPRDIEAGIAAFESARERPVTITRKKGEKQVDLKEIVDALRIANTGDRARIPQALAATLLPSTLYLRLRLDGPAQVKPQEVLAAVLGRDVDLRPVDVIRVGLWDVHQDELISPLEAELPAPGAHG
jgi:radical SAM-linked protein